MWPLNKRRTKKKKINGYNLLPKNDPTSIGNLAVACSIISSDELEDILEDFKNSGSLFGEYLLSHSEVHITKEQLEYLLLKQKKLRGEKLSHEDIMSIIKLARATQDKYTQSVANFNRALEGKAV